MTDKYKELKRRFEEALDNGRNDEINKAFREAKEQAMEEYAAAFGYKTRGGYGSMYAFAVLDDIESAVATGSPCMHPDEEEQVRAYYKRQGKKLPKEYRDFYANDPRLISI